MRINEERILEVVGLDERAELELGFQLLVALTSRMKKEQPSTCDGLK